VDGIPDVVEHGVNGWLCREKDPVDLAEKLSFALDTEASSAVADRARVTANEHDWSQVAENYMAEL
jgi:glycosyltransferase involved in cell wall biosynthesis